MYGDLDWVVPTLLARCDPACLYFDAVSQVVMPRWSTGHVALVEMLVSVSRSWLDKEPPSRSPLEAL